MKHPLEQRRTAPYWLLDLLMVGMLGLLLLLFWIGIPAEATTLVVCLWSGLTLGGMAVWVWANRGALSSETEERLGGGPWERPDRPLTAVQRHFLAVRPSADAQPSASGPPAAIDQTSNEAGTS